MNLITDWINSGNSQAYQSYNPFGSDSSISEYLKYPQKYFGSGSDSGSIQGDAPSYGNTKSTFTNMKNIYKQMKALDMNQDGKITVDDFILLLKEKGLGPLSKPLAKRLFNMADSNKNGVLEFQDVVKLMELLKHVNLGALNLA